MKNYNIYKYTNKEPEYVLIGSAKNTEEIFKIIDKDKKRCKKSSKYYIEESFDRKYIPVYYNDKLNIVWSIKYLTRVFLCLIKGKHEFVENVHRDPFVELCKVCGKLRE